MMRHEADGSDATPTPNDPVETTGHTPDGVTSHRPPAESADPNPEPEPTANGARPPLSPTEIIPAGDATAGQDAAPAAPGATGHGEPAPEPAAAHATTELSTPRTHRWGFGAFLLTELVFLLVSVVISIPFGEARAHAPLTGPVLFLVLAIPTLLAAAVALLATVLRGNGPRRDLVLHWRWSDVGTGLGIGLAGLVVTAVASTIWARVVGPEHANSSVGSVLDNVRLSPTWAVVVFLHLWLLAPLCEEVIYRGLLWGAMERMQWGRWATFAGTTAIFAVAHLEPERTPLLLIIGIPIGLARLFTGRLLASIIAHQVNNFLPAVGLLLMTLGVTHS